jgi:hypothetical protein
LNITVDSTPEGLSGASGTLTYQNGGYSNLGQPTSTDAPAEEVDDFAGFYVSVEVSEPMTGTLTFSATSQGGQYPSDQGTYQTLTWPQEADLGFSKGVAYLMVQFTSDSNGPQDSRNLPVQGPAIILQSLNLGGLNPFAGLDTAGRIQAPLKKLGYTTFMDLKASTAKTLSDYVKGKQIWYSLCHGLFPRGGLPVPGNRFIGLSFLDNVQSDPTKLLAGAIKASDLTPLELDYRLVIVDGCASAQTSDSSETEATASDAIYGASQQFAQSFGPNVAYLGWGYKVMAVEAQTWSGKFLSMLKTSQTVGDAFTAFRKYNPSDSAKLLKFFGNTDNTIAP